MTDWKIVAAQIKAFDQGREVVKAMRKGIREPLPYIRRSIKARAVRSLPKRGGLNRWVASTRVSGSLKLKSRAVEFKIKGGRNSSGGRSDVNAIDRGRVRAPAWGKRGPGAWHSQSVTPGFFTEPAQEAGNLVDDAIDRSVDLALETIRRG